MLLSCLVEILLRSFSDEYRGSCVFVFLHPRPDLDLGGLVLPCVDLRYSLRGNSTPREGFSVMCEEGIVAKE